jgi:hypothetical protein
VVGGAEVGVGWFGTGDAVTLLGFRLGFRAVVVVGGVG